MSISVPNCDSDKHKDLFHAGDKFLSFSCRYIRRGASMGLRTLFRGGNQKINAGVEQVLILTPVKDAYDCLPGYERRIQSVTCPHELISLGFLESDSSDRTWLELGNMATWLRNEFSSVTLRKKDFRYRLPDGCARAADHALREQSWVLWLDGDVVEYPPDIIQRLLNVGKQIVDPNCVLDYGGKTFDRNAWRDQGRSRTRCSRWNHAFDPRGSASRWTHFPGVPVW